jgi:hypothetical protein
MSMMSFYVSSLDFLLHSARTLVIRDIAVFLVAVLLWKVFLNLFVCYSVELFGFFPPQFYSHFHRDRGSIPRVPHLIPWVGNLKALFLEPVAWPFRMHEKYVG